VLVCKTGNEKMAKLIKELRVSKGAELNGELYLISTKRENKENRMGQGNTLQVNFKFLLVND
jgi:hypothetical protein